MQNQPTPISQIANLESIRTQPQKFSASQEHTPSRELQARIGKATSFVITEVIPTFTVYTPDFAAKFGDNIDAVAREYAARLVKHGITRKDVMRGLERLKLRAKGKDKWSVNPEEFVDLCKPQPQDFGIPDLEDAIREIVEARSPARAGQGPYDFSHRVVEMMNQRIGYEVRTLTADEFKKKAKGEYDYWVKRAMKGDIPEPRKAIAYHQEPELPEYLKNAPQLNPKNSLHAKLLNTRKNIRARKEAEIARED